MVKLAQVLSVPHVWVRYGLLELFKVYLQAVSDCVFNSSSLDVPGFVLESFFIQVVEECATTSRSASYY